jgi:hypothetical protein
MVGKRTFTTMLISAAYVLPYVVRKENRWKMLGVRGEISLQHHQPVI